MRRILVTALCLILAAALSVGAFAYSPRHQTEAEALSDLGLLRGTGSGFDLGSESTRAEAAVMLARLMGGESAAVSENSAHPFTDVPGWASPSVGWLYKNGLTTGATPTTFDSAGKISAQQYAAFLLRALGYSSAPGGDFEYANALDFTVISGLITRDQKLDLIGRPFYRDDMVFLSFRALATYMNGEVYRLADRLVNRGVFTASQYAKAAEKPIETEFALGDNGRLISVQSGGARFVSQNTFTKIWPADTYIVGETSIGNLCIINKQTLSELPFLPDVNLDPIARSGDNMYFMRSNAEGQRSSLVVYDGHEMNVLLPAFAALTEPTVNDDSITLFGMSGGSVNMWNVVMQSTLVRKVFSEPALEAYAERLSEKSVVLLLRDETNLSVRAAYGDTDLGVYASPLRSGALRITHKQTADGRTVFSADSGLFALNETNRSFERLSAVPVLHFKQSGAKYYVVTGGDVPGSVSYGEIGIVDENRVYSPVLQNALKYVSGIAVIETVTEDSVYFSNKPSGASDTFHYYCKNGEIGVVAYSELNEGYTAALEHPSAAALQKAADEQARLDGLYGRAPAARLPENDSSGKSIPTAGIPLVNRVSK